MDYFGMGFGPGNLIFSVVLAVIGIIFLAAPTAAMSGIIIAAGIVMTIYGIVMLCTRVSRHYGEEIRGPILWIVGGVLLIVFSWAVVRWILPVAVGIWMIVLGASNLRNPGLQAAMHGRTPQAAMVFGILDIALGVVSIVSAASGGWGIGIILGVCLLLYSIPAIVRSVTQMRF